MKVLITGFGVILIGLLASCTTISTSPSVNITPSGSTAKWTISAKGVVSPGADTIFLYINGTQVITGKLSPSPALLNGVYQGHAIQASCKALTTAEKGGAYISGNMCIIYVDQAQETTLLF